MKDFELKAFIGMPVTITTPEGHIYRGDIGMLRPDNLFCLRRYEKLHPLFSKESPSETGVNYPAISTDGYKLVFDRAPDVEITIERTH